MRNVIKILTAVLILSMVFTVFSCNTSSGSGNDTTTGGAETGNAENAENTDNTDEISFPYETRDFGGAAFRILIDTQWEGNMLDIKDYDVEELNGEVLNDAYWNRNHIIEDTYNIELKAIHQEDIEAFVNKTIKSGMDEYDAYAPRLMNAAKFAAKGYGVNLLDTTLTLDAPWWDQNIISDTSIGGCAYFIAGDIFIKHYDGIALLMFNKQLILDLGLESPYNYVNNNEWTIDKFNQMVKGVYFDVNNDNKMDRYDRYGFVTQADYVTSFVNGSGERFISKDSNDLPVFTGNTEKMTSIFDKMLDVYITDTYCMHRNAYGKESGSGQPVQFWVFPEGRGLFYWAFPRYMDLGLRDMEDDFGIVPIPKWDSNQSRYYATVNNWHSYTFMIPITVADVEKTSYILDAMAYHGRNIIKPAYYDVCLQRKYTRDDESSAMLDIIFSSTVYDIGTVYDVGTYANAFENDIQKESINVASTYEKLAGKIDSDITKLISNFEANKQ